MPLTNDARAVLKAFADGSPPGESIALLTKVSLPEVRRIIDSVGGDRQAARRALADDTASRTTPPPAVTPRPAAAVSPGLAALVDVLARAEGHAEEDIRVEGQRLRGEIHALGRLIDQAADRAEARRLVADLEARLVDARRALAVMTPKSERGKASRRPGPDPKVVRIWATNNQVECPAHGRLPKSVEAKYLASLTAGAVL